MFDFNGEKILNLQSVIEDVRRRKISDLKKDINYIDPNKYLNKLSSSNNHVILGRRGSGKTTILLKRIELGENEIPIKIECQPLKQQSGDIIIAKLFIEIINSINNWIYDNYNDKFADYNRKTVRIKRFLKSNGNVDHEIEALSELSLFISELKKSIELIQTKPDTITILKNWKSNQSSKKTINKKISGKAKVSLSTKKNILKGIASGVVDLESTISSDLEHLKSINENIDISSEEKQEIKRVDLIKQTIEILTKSINQLYETTGFKIVLFLDDYYLINEQSQIFVINELHNLYKVSIDSCFCFKLNVLPSRLKLNPDGSYDLSLKDDFSPIRLDYDLFNLEILKEHLLSIISNLNTSDNTLTILELRSLFVNDEALSFAVIAAGGVPRDFMILLSDLVNTARKECRNTISKANIYTVVNELKEDKDQNIEVDSDISPDVIRKSIEQITKDIVGNHKTNVFLYDKERNSLEESILKNLINLRYVHLIKENISSEIIKKKTFDAYLIDMIFYATGKRIPSSFNFRKFWETDDKNRYPQLHRAPILLFDKDSV